VSGVGLRDGPEAVHTEEAQQQGAHEQPTEPQWRLRSCELSEAGHNLIVGTGHWSLASQVPPE
jgi:hypothetical protein